MPLHSDTLSDPTISLCSYSLMLRTSRKSRKYQYNSLWFSTTEAWTHDRGSNPRSTSCEASTLNITPPMRSKIIYFNYITVVITLLSSSPFLLQKQFKICSPILIIALCRSLICLYNARSLTQQSSSRHAASLGNIILIPSQTVLALTL